MPALLETAVRPVMCVFFDTSLMRVSGTPHRPKPPQRIVESEGRSLMASEAEGTILLISRLGRVVVNVRASRRER